MRRLRLRSTPLVAGLALCLSLATCLDLDAGPCADATRVHSPVAGGDTLSGLAARYDVPGGVEALARLNDFDDPDVIRAGSGLLIPATPASAHLPAYEPPELASAAALCDALALGTISLLPEDAGARCLDLGDGHRLCRDAHGAALHHGARELARWPLPDIGPTPWENTAVYRAELDGRPGAELVAVSHLGTSNGIAVTTYAVAVLHLDAPAERLLTYTVVGHGYAWRRDPDDPARCLLPHSAAVTARSTMLGPGHYDLERPLRYTQAGGVETAAGLPLRAARLAPVPTELWWEEPLLRDRDPEGYTRVTVAAAARRPHRGWASHALELALTASDGGRLTLTSDAQEVDDGPLLERLGDAATGLLLPDDVAPPPATLIGRRGRLVRYPPRWGDAPSSYVLWLDR